MEKCQCEGRLKLVNGILVYKTPHTCLDVGKCELLKAIGDFYTRVLTNSSVPVHEVYLAQRRKFEYLGLNVDFPSFEEMQASFSQLKFDEPEAAQQEPASVPSTSGVVPKPSASTANPSVPSQPHVKSCVPVQADVRDSAKHCVPVPSNLRPTPTPVVAKKPPTTPELNPLPPPLEDDSSISVKWNTYATNMSSVMPSLLEDEKFVDVTLACDGKYIKCHKVILGACSPYFEELLSVNPCQHPIILMKDFHFWEIRAIVDFMYRGVVNIPQHQLPKLLQVANVLQIKGLTGSKNDTESKDELARSRESPSKVGSKCRKRSELPSAHRSKPSEVPVKKMKIISKSSSRNSSESHSSDESSDQLQVSQSTSPVEPPTPLHSVCIKEETNYDEGDDPPGCPYGNDQNLDKDNFSQLGQFQLLTLPGSKTIKQEVNEDTLDSRDQDPLNSESGVS